MWAKFGITEICSGLIDITGSKKSKILIYVDSFLSDQSVTREVHFLIKLHDDFDHFW